MLFCYNVWRQNNSNAFHLFDFMRLCFVWFCVKSDQLEWEIWNDATENQKENFSLSIFTACVSEVCLSINQLNKFMRFLHLTFHRIRKYFTFSRLTDRQTDEQTNSMRMFFELLLFHRNKNERKYARNNDNHINRYQMLCLMVYGFFSSFSFCLAFFGNKMRGSTIYKQTYATLRSP